jgi:hypothetical protein
MASDMQFGSDILWGIALIVVTFGIHTGAMLAVNQTFDSVRGRWPTMMRPGPGHILMGGLITMMVGAHLTEILTWALFFRVAGAFEYLRVAFYFAASTATTLGATDVVLPESLRMMAPMLAIAGIITFFWSAGLLISILGRERVAGRASGRG